MDNPVRNLDFDPERIAIGGRIENRIETISNPTLNLFNTKNLQITHCKYSQFKIDMKKKIKEIYEASCFKMDPIFVLEFDKKKYYETLNEQKKLLQNETNNSND